MDDLALARALHVLAIVHWIGGLAFVTMVVLPSLAKLDGAGRRLAAFEAVEGRFSAQAKVSVTLAGLTGFYMAHRMDAWERFADPAFWWMAAMAALWAIFSAVLFVAEPLFLHAWFRRRAARDEDGTLAFVRRAHVVLLAAALATVAGAALGAHGGGLW